MGQGVLQLLSALSEKERLLEEMLKVLEDERRCILTRDLAGLDEQVEKKIELFESLEGLGSHCREIVDEMSADLDLAEEKTLSPVIARLADPQREQLQGVQRSLLERGALLEGMLASNADLLQGALQTVNRSLDFFGQLFKNDSNTYGNAGKMLGAKNSPRIIRREA